MKEADEIKKQELFEENLKAIQEFNKKEKKAIMDVELYYRGVECANEGVPYEEVEHMGLNNEVSFMKGYNETLESLGKSR